ncbi:MAG: hypothetical protein U9R00_01890 [Patescibacteria group bacterium]|nr:hypothetical protein [Patescibacteria group bacterium]
MRKEYYLKSPVIASSGLLGFSGEGWWFHKLIIFLTLNFPWVTFQTKTVTANKREGNLKEGEKNPKCVSINPWPFKAYAVNNISLTNKGIKAYIDDWRKLKGEVHLSIMTIEKDKKQRMADLRKLVYFLQKYLKDNKADKVILHYNVFCPNTGENVAKYFSILKEEIIFLKKKLEIDLFLKVGWDFPVDIAKDLEEFVDGFDAINTIPFNKIAPYKQKRYFKKGENVNYISPLDKHQDSFKIKGRGGVSGRPLRYFALRWIRDARKAGITKYIIGGGGILRPIHVFKFKVAGANAISPGSIVFLRPHHLIPVILTAKLIFKKY